MGIDYAKMWLTLLRTGIKNRFSTTRVEFFMSVASTGKVTFCGSDVIEQCVADSYFASYGMQDKLHDIVTSQLTEDTTFKYYQYQTIDQCLSIDYFAKIGGLIDTTALPSDIDLDTSCLTQNKVQGLCLSTSFVEESDNGSDIPIVQTAHCILIGETDTLIPEDYPSIIKHELTHACLVETTELLKQGVIIQTVPVAETWSEMDKVTWVEDLATLTNILLSHDKESNLFKEFVCEYLMYESDGPIKVQNPIMESRKDKAKKRRGVKQVPKPNPKVTFKTVTPYDRFQDDLYRYTAEYQEGFQKIINDIKDRYGDYDKFTYLAK